MKKIFLKIWNDNVWSTVIATAIIALFSYWFLAGSNQFNDVEAINRNIDSTNPINTIELGKNVSMDSSTINQSSIDSISNSVKIGDSTELRNSTIIQSNANKAN